MTIGDLISVRSFPAVVQAADVRSLRDAVPQQNEQESGELDEAAHDFIGGYLGFDERARHAVDATVGSLAERRGGAFFLNGVFGSGKSHLLGLLALLCDGDGYEVFTETHPYLAAPLRAFGPRLVVHFSLDEYSAAGFSLEDIFWREVRSEWQRRGFPPDELSGAAQQPNNASVAATPTNDAHTTTTHTSGSRSEGFAALEESLRAHGLNGLVVCIDELSLFLSGREHRALQTDAAFLQFLGQRARRQYSSGAPLWIVAALQKTVEDIGDLDAYALSQIRDRFSTLPLGLAHLPSLIERRLVIRRDDVALHRLCDESYHTLLRALPRLDFGREEWERLYPFHPATVALLEAVAARFGSRTRSAALFCAGAVRPSDDAAQHVLPDALFDYIEPELSAHPDLRPLAAIWKTWRDEAADVHIPQGAIEQATNPADREEAARLGALMKTLLLFKIAGTAPSVAQVANALALDARLPGEGNYEYCRILLEKLRARAPIAVERRDDDWADRYAVDLGTRVGEMARRFTANAMHTLPPRDGRIARHALHCCRDEALPLAALEASPSAHVMWRNTQRSVRLEMLAAPPDAATLANRLAALAAAGHADDLLVFIAPPFDPHGALDESETSDGNEPRDASGAWRETARAAWRSLDGLEERWRGALVWWLPRAPSHDEWQQARETTAQHLLMSDPQLHDNRRGRAVLEHLKNGEPSREAALGRIAARLLREGQLATAAGASLDAAELAGGDSWTATLESLVEWALPTVFPRFVEVAPRARVLTPSVSDSLCLEILRRPASAPYFAASLERAARAVAAPLGIAREERGRWKISAPQDALAREVCALAADGGATLSVIEAALARSEWGVVAEQTNITICALLRGGELAAFDARGQTLPPAAIGLPLRRAVHTLRPGRLLEEASWRLLQELVALLTDGSQLLGLPSFAEQERALSLLGAWRDDMAAQTELAQARMHQWWRRFGQTAAQWPQAEASREIVTSLLHALSGGSSAEVLSRAAAFAISDRSALDDARAAPLSDDTPRSDDTLRSALQTWRATVEKLEARHAPLLEVHAFLAHPELAAPAALQPARAALLVRFDSGEAVLDDETLLDDTRRWVTEYEAAYRDWHRAQHAPPRFAVYRRLLASDAARALEKLAALTSRSFAHGAQLREAVGHELAKACPRDGALHGEPVCPACRLRLGERLLLRDPREIETLVEAGVTALCDALHEPATRDYLSRREAAAGLLLWSDHKNFSIEQAAADGASPDGAATDDSSNDGDGAALLPLLSESALQLLDEAFRPRRRVVRSLSALREQVEGCRTRAEWQRALLLWLDGGDALSDDDELELSG